MRFADTIVYQYRRWRYRGKPTPKIQVYARRSIPAWAVRVLAGMAASACVVLAALHSPMPVTLAIALASGLGIGMLARPGYEVAMTSIFMAGLLLFGSSHPHVDPLIGWIIAAAYLTLRLAMVSCLLTWTSTIELRAIFTWRDAVIAGLTGLIGCTALLPGSGWWAVVLGSLGLVVVSLVILPKTHDALYSYRMSRPGGRGEI